VDIAGILIIFSHQKSQLIGFKAKGVTGPDYSISF
jgi:hypothetical protein